MAFLHNKYHAVIIGLHHIKVNPRRAKPSSLHLGDLWEVFLVTWFRLRAWSELVPKEDPERAIAEVKRRSAWTAAAIRRQVLSSGLLISQTRVQKHPPTPLPP